MVYENRARRNCHPNERKWPIIWTIPWNRGTHSKERIVEYLPITDHGPLENTFVFSFPSMVKYLQFSKSRGKEGREKKLPRVRALVLLDSSMQRWVNVSCNVRISRGANPFFIYFTIGGIHRFLSIHIYLFFSYSPSNFRQTHRFKITYNRYPSASNYGRGGSKQARTSRGFHNAATLERARLRR